MSLPAEGEGAVVGVDVGGTKIRAGVVRGTEVVEMVERPTDVASAEAVIGGLEGAVRELTARTAPPSAVGVGLPSQIDFRAGRVLTSVNIPLADVPFRDALTERLGVPVQLDNDANCAALAEAGAAAGGSVRELVMLTLGTGVGGGVVIEGRVFRGATGLGAELGHLVVDRDGPECPGSCPNRGCLEALCSGQALARDAGTLAAARPASRLAQLARERGGPPAGADVVVAAREGDREALELFERFGAPLGVGMASLMNAFEPELLVVGGGISQVADLFLGRAEDEARARALPAISARVRIALARTGTMAGVIGAARLAATETFERSRGGPPGAGTRG